MSMKRYRVLVWASAHLRGVAYVDAKNPKVAEEIVLDGDAEVEWDDPQDPDVTDAEAEEDAE